MMIPEPDKTSADWQQHEHVSVPTQAQAQKLLDEAGSPEIAKHAVDEAAKERSEGPTREEERKKEIVRESGFASWEMVKALSTILVASDGLTWWITPHRQTGWMLWNQHDAQAPKLFASLEEARRHISHGAPPDLM